MYFQLSARSIPIVDLPSSPHRLANTPPTFHTNFNLPPRMRRRYLHLARRHSNSLHYTIVEFDKAWLALTLALAFANGVNNGQRLPIASICPPTNRTALHAQHQ
ncbi:hypothetical protein BCR44DRAFT_1511572 [Catenaria anguillulae PL171]|uniref:Uncharacterized protein n=1 Tax=Catenaria anguillulae PL171 TaxID=765915 RepID=A0A1Y2HTD4_9FUNG|nr:hypothetical protein BCR44DRAFT_1511572 [Catenaria anguillulae PL171]